MRQADRPQSAASFASPSAAADAECDGSVLSALTRLAAKLDIDSNLRATILGAIAEIDGLRTVAVAIAARYRSLIDAVPDAVTIHDETGRILDANDAACRIYERNRDELTRLTVYDLNPSLEADHMAKVAANFALGETITESTINQRRDGSTFPVEVHSNIYRDGGEWRVLAVARDTSHRERADVELRASEARFRLLLQAMDKGVIVQTADGRISSCNPAACRILGLSESTLLGADRNLFSEWRYFDDRGRPIDFTELPGYRAFQSGKTVESTVFGLYAPPHMLRWLSASSVPQFLPGSQQPFQVVSTFSDVTALKHEGELFEQTQQLANIGGWEIDLAHDRLTWTEQIYRIFDMPIDTPLTIERSLEHFAIDDRERIRRALDMGRRGESADLEARLTTAIGRRRWVRIVTRPLKRGSDVYAIVGTLQDVTERKLVEEQLRQRALTDPITGLANRDAMLNLLEAEIAVATPQRGPALLYVDLDRFKIVNDILGHGAGDRLLASAADRLRSTLPADARCARFGGDEFAVLLPSTAPDEVPGEVAEAITNVFARPFSYGGEEFSLTASIGLARFPHDGTTVQQLVNHSDAATGEAKRRGRNTWQSFSPALARRLSDRLVIETQLRRALDNGEFRLEFQPQVDLASGRVIGAEALLRWHNRQLGELRPDVFVTHAENTGDIVPIGAWVIRDACRQLRGWRDAGVPLPRIAVNVSYRQMLSETLAETVVAALREYDLPGESLELEMTERVLIEDAPDTMQTFAILQRLGVLMTIDDFGEGYSALTYLRRLPIDGLKISHSFMHGVPTNASDAAICEAIIRIGQSLGLSVVAEGVETEEQREFLLSRGLVLAQGYLFSRPLTPARLVDYVREHNARV